MPLLDNWDLSVTTDEVLRAQGADPDVLRIRRPALLATTDQAIISGSSILHPQVLFEKYSVKGLLHERLEVEGCLIWH